MHGPSFILGFIFVFVASFISRKMNWDKRSQPHIDKAKDVVYDSVSKFGKFLKENQHVFTGDEQVMLHGI